MAFEEIKFGGETLKFEKKGDSVTGILKEVRLDVGPNNSKIYFIDTGNDVVNYWGASALDPLMDSVNLGDRVRITCIDDKHKFPNGRTGKNFKVEVDRK